MAYSNSTIEQAPLYDQLPVGQEIIFVVSNTPLVSTETKVKFCAEVYISGDDPANPNAAISSDLIGTFKTTPNNAGVGIFDFRNVIENYVSADNMASNGSAYKTISTTDNTPHPLQIIDKYSLSDNSVRYMVIRFYAEYLGADASTPTAVSKATGTEQDSAQLILFNGYLKHTDLLGIFNSNFGYSLNDFTLDGQTKNFLSNAPTTQEAFLNDYGTLSFLAFTGNVSYIKLTYTSFAGVALGNEQVLVNAANGAYDGTYDAIANQQLLHFGCFPGNLQNWNATWQSSIFQEAIQGGSYLVQAFDAADGRASGRYTINVNCPKFKGYESIRLCWLNQWGAWDYYTFTQKSIRNISTQGTTYQQLQGTWNENRYRIDTYRGGKKAFRVNATERIIMNTDFVSADYNTMFEELINSPEVYLLDDYQTDISFAALNQYVTPVRLTTSSFTRKTVANDKLIQYTFEVEKSKTLRTQAV